MNSKLTDQYLTLQEFVTAAHKRLPESAWGYIIGGAETETTVRRNRQALDGITLRPRVLNDVSEIDCRSTLFGKSVRLPVFLCPVGGLESFDESGAIGVAKAACQFGVPSILSSVSSWTPEKLISECNEDLSLVYQLYARDTAANIDLIVDRCNDMKLPAFCITVDSASYSRRERDIVTRFQKPWRARGEGNSAHYQAALNWSDIARIRERFNGPLILKGIATPEDAKIAVEHGVEIIYISNHGGRQLDHVGGSTSALTGIVAAVNGHAQIFIDGGFYRGTDVVKALALGADGVGLGRMMCFALAAAGPDGIVRMLELLEEEIRIALALLGVCNYADLDESHVQSEVPLAYPSALHSAFPLLNNIDAMLRSNYSTEEPDIPE